MNRLSTNRPTAGRPSLVAFMSGKGGVGKSVIAFNLAHVLADKGHPVLLVDGDLFGGNQHILANTAIEQGLGDYLTGQISLNQAVTHLSENLSLLGIGEIDPDTDLPADTLAVLASRLRHDAAGYDVVLIDHPSGRSATVSEFASVIDTVILTVVPELTSLSDGYGLFKDLSNSASKTDCRLLVNWTENDSEADYIRSKFGLLTKQFLQRSPGWLGHLSVDDAVRQAVARQKPVAEIAPETAFVGGLNDLATAVLNRPRPNTHEQIHNLANSNNLPATADIGE